MIKVFNIYLYIYTYIFSTVPIARSFVFCVVFCWSLFICLFFFIWPLCCLSVFD